LKDVEQKDNNIER